MVSFEISIFIPIKPLSNRQDHWAVAYKRHKKTKEDIQYFLNPQPKIPLPATVTLTRKATHFYDDDNLQHALKYVRDVIANYLIPGKPSGHTDNDPRITWIYKQEKVKKEHYGIQINICHNGPHGAAAAPNKQP